MNISLVAGRPGVKQIPQEFPLTVRAGEGVFVPTIATPDAEGRFRVAPLLVGERYSADVIGGLQGTTVLGKAFADLVLKPGETRDLGDVRVKQPAEAK